MYSIYKKATIVAMALLIGLGNAQRAQGMLSQPWAQDTLWKAIKKGSYCGVREALEDYHAQVNVKIKNESGDTPLTLACRMHSKATIIKLLIEKDADVNFQNKDGEVPLTWPCLTNDTEIIKLLVDKGADINVRNLFGQNLLEQACQLNTSETPGSINTLVAYGLEISPWRAHQQMYEPIISQVPLEYQILGIFHTNTPAFENIIALMVKLLLQKNTLDSKHAKEAKEALNKIKSLAREYDFAQASSIIATIKRRFLALLNVQKADVEFSFDN